jgi:hypothetical protein
MLALVGSPATAGNAIWKTGGEPGILMKNKQLNAELNARYRLLLKTKCLKLNRLSIAYVGYHGTEI